MDEIVLRLTSSEVEDARFALVKLAEKNRKMAADVPSQINGWLVQQADRFEALARKVSTASLEGEE